MLAVLFFVVALIFGVLMTLPIGGADMPVVISLYNAFTGLSVGLEGYAMQNPTLMIAGMVVGSAGTLLTVLMAKAMNRSLFNVLFSNFGAGGGMDESQITGSQKPADAGDAAIAMRYAQSVVIVPGYGLAVAQAQQKLYELVRLLQAADVEVKFAVHPVAGRMPGPHERAAGRGRRAVRHHLRHGGDQRGVRQRRRRPGDRRQRRGESRPRAPTRARRSTACRS